MTGGYAIGGATTKDICKQLCIDDTYCIGVNWYQDGDQCEHLFITGELVSSIGEVHIPVESRSCDSGKDNL